jgi:hypothetical protein
MNPPREAQNAEEALSALAMATRGIERIDPQEMTEDQVQRLRLMISELDRLSVHKWRA